MDKNARQPNENYHQCLSDKIYIFFLTLNTLSTLGKLGEVKLITSKDAQKMQIEPNWVYQTPAAETNEQKVTFTPPGSKNERNYKLHEFL